MVRGGLIWTLQKICICILICTAILIIILGIIIHILNDIRVFLERIYNAINYSTNKMVVQNMSIKSDYLRPFLYKIKDIIAKLDNIEKLLSKTEE